MFTTSGQTGDHIRSARLVLSYRVLAESSVGIAMETGNGIAIESAGVTLVGGDVRGGEAVSKLSRKLMSDSR